MAITSRAKLHRRAFLKAASIGSVAVTLAGARAGFAQPKSLEKVSVFIGTTPHFGNIVVGAEKGFFEKEGLPVQVTNFASGSTAVDAFRAGQGNLVVAGDLPSLRLWKQGGIGLCAQANYGELSIIVAKKSINKPADLRGKKVGILIGSTSEYFAKLYLASGGVDYKEIDVINLRPAEMVTGLVRGDIDAFVIWQPFGWRAVEADSNTHIVTTGEPYFHEWEMVSTMPEYAQTHGAEIVAFLKGLDQAGKWIPGNLNEAAQIVAKSLRMDDVAIVKRMLEKIDWNIAYTKKFRSDMDRIGTFVGIPVEWSKMFDPKFLVELGPTYVET
jgi:ABC-type nitrate/sulfonate/bicarbonate transport system substrate-binding protein